MPPTVVAHEPTEGPVGAFGKVYRGNPAVAIRLGAPRDGEFSVDLIRQGFEHGVMIRRGDTGEIMVLRRDGVWFLYQDSWTVGESLGEPPGRGEEPLEGGKAPERGFGKLWRQQAEVRRAMGMAIGDEQASVGTMQRFAGGWMLSVDYRLIYVLYSDGNWRSFADTFTPPGAPASPSPRP